MTLPAEAETLTVREALKRHREHIGQPIDDSAAAGLRWRPLEALPFELPNFEWRQRALPVHDLHHVLMGYACTPSGEFEMAAWEFAAGRFPHAGATAFCLPLIGLGALSFPRRSFDAFVRGRTSRSLYAQGLTPALLERPLDDLRRTVAPVVRPLPSWCDRLIYAAWVAAALGWLAAPVVVLAIGGLAAWR